MAELILTEEEKAAATWLELPDDVIGKLVKKTALQIVAESNEQGRIFTMTAMILLCGMASDANAETTKIEVNGFHKEGEELGDWRMVLQRIDRRPGVTTLEDDLNTLARLIPRKHRDQCGILRMVCPAKVDPARDCACGLEDEQESLGRLRQALGCSDE